MDAVSEATERIIDTGQKLLRGQKDLKLPTRSEQTHVRIR